MQLNLDPTERNLPGEALLCIRKWSGASTDLKLTIQRNQDHYYLQADSSWNSPPYWFIIDQLDSHEDLLSVPVGPQVVDPLLAISVTSTFKVEMQDSDGHQEENVLRCDRNLLGSTASGETVSTYAFGRLQIPLSETIPDPATELSAPAAPIAEPSPPPAPQPQKPTHSALLYGVLLLILILIAAGAYWWWSQRNHSSDTAPPSSVAVEPPEPTAANTPPAAAEPTTTDTPPIAAAPISPCDLAGYQPPNELTFVKTCATSDASSDVLLSTISQAKAAGQCGIAQRLYANRGQSGDSRIALAYAREYDPKFHQNNTCFKESDPSIAAYWYEAVLAVEPDNAQAKERLQELSQ
ncbi:hypothetical protein [Castellaniella sp.]|uniref:hypothetical protein n=1 Tax=Castellaniella sp. TaxID=1955812 RepID=UPI002B0033E5|nr:hypothetical protein [Castellaniella sp.]